MKNAPKVPKQSILTAALLFALANPAYAQQAPQAQTSRPVVPTGKPAWAQ